MKRTRILPGAAGIIALTATMGFVDGQRDADNEYALRETYTETRVLASMPGADTPIPPDASAYMISVKRGAEAKVVLVDAHTGRILKV